MKKLTLVLLALLALVLVGGNLTPASCQEVTAAIVGTVVDPSGAPIKGATVVATDTERGVTWNAQTNETGSFNLLRLPVGTYKAEATAGGFEKTIYPPFTLALNQTARLSFQMKVGKVTESVEVSGTAPILQTEDAQVGNVMDSNSITSLSLTSRNYIQLTLLQPGVVTTDPSTFNFGSQTAEGANNGGGRPYINGNREEDNNFLLDGVDNNQASDNLTGYTPSPDAIGEFNLITQNASAEFGNYAGGIINATIKSGTNKFHGDVFEFLRNDFFNANKWENSPYVSNTPGGLPTPKLRWNIYGGTVGGPIIKNKLFFFGDYEGTRRDLPASAGTLTVLTAAETGGNFATICQKGFTAGICNDRDTNGNVIDQLYNPCTAGTGGSSSTPCNILTPASRPAFLGNIIPAADLNPAFKAMVNSPFYPKAVGGLTSTGFGSAVNTTFNRYNTDQGDIKVDYIPSGKDHVSARYSKSDEFDPGTNSQPLLGNSLSEAWLNNGSANWTHTFSPNLLNEVRFGKNAIKLIAPTVTFDPSVGNFANTIGITDGNPAGIQGLPEFGFSGGTASSVATGTLTNLGSLVNPQHFSSTVTQFDESLIYTHGRHVIKSGFQLQKYNLNVFYPGNAGELGAIVYGLGPGGNYTGTQGAVKGQPSPTAGDPSGDWALGLPESVGRGVSTGGWHARDWLFAGFVQDDWRVTDTLTLNLGLRYENRTPWTELHNHQVNVNIYTGALQFIGNTPVPTGIVGSNGFSSGLYPATNGLPDFQPRFGFAWSPTMWGGKTVIRGGFSISSFQEGTGTNLRPTQNPPFTPPQSAGQNVGSGTSAFNTESAFAAAAPPAGDLFINSTMLSWTNVQPAVADQWNLTVQRELARNTTLQIGYVAQRTTHLMVPIDLDQGLLHSDGSVTYPFIGGLNKIGTVINGIKTTAPTYGPNGLGLVKQSAAVGNMNYNALQAVLAKKYSNGLEAQVSYTWQKCMANSAGYYGSWGGQSQNADSYWQNIFNPNGDYARCYWDTTNELTAYAVYDLPIGRGKRIGHNLNSAVNAVVGNWAISPAITWHGGFPLNLRGSDNSGTQDIFSPRPNCNGPVSYPKQTVVGGMQWFDPGAFSNPGPGSFGNCPSQGPVIGPGYSDTDISMQKNIPFSESMRLQFRADFLNVFNHPNFNAPSTSIGVGMGLLTNTQDAREMMFALKFYF